MRSLEVGVLVEQQVGGLEVAVDDDGVAVVQEAQRPARAVVIVIVIIIIVIVIMHASASSSSS